MSKYFDSSFKDLISHSNFQYKLRVLSDSANTKGMTYLKNYCAFYNKHIIKNVS